MKLTVLTPDGARAELEIAGAGRELEVRRGEERATVRVLVDDDPDLVFELDGRIHHARVVALPDGWSVVLRGRESRYREASSSGGDGAAARAEPILRANLPGRVLRVLVGAGDRVRTRDTLLIIEAMKMENPVEAPADGEVVSLHVREGEMVQVGQDLVTCAYEASSPPREESD